MSAWKRTSPEDVPVERVELTLETVQLARIAQVIATNVRRGSHRKVKVVDHKSGEVLREAPLDEFYIGVAKTLDLTFSTREDAPQTVCAGWEGPCPEKAGPPPKWAFQPRHIAKRKGEPWRCRSCGNRMAQARIDPATRSQVAKERAARDTTWSERVRRGIARMTEEERRQRTQPARNARSPEHFRKAWATRRAKKDAAE